MKIKNILTYFSTGLLLCGLFACTNSDPEFSGPDFPGGGIGGGDADNGDAPTFDTTITPWNGEKADDASKDNVGNDSNLYQERNTFSNKVTVAFDNDNATVTSSNSKIKCEVEGAYVAIDMSTGSVGATEIILSGHSDNGGLKIYGKSNCKLTLNGVELTSQRGPAINNQDKKNLFVVVTDGTTNTLTDATAYSDDHYYLAGVDPLQEDRKGCFFSEGHMVFSGTGVLIVTGRYNHAIVTDGCFRMRPGVTLVVPDAVNNAVQVKGDTDKAIGVEVLGGLLYANNSSVAGKAIKTDYNINVSGGQLLLNTSGNATYVAEEKDTSSASCIKADGEVLISGGKHTLKSTGAGGKGINAVGLINIKGGETTVTTIGGKYTYLNTNTSSPKGVKSDVGINISGGTLNIAVMGNNDSAEGLEASTINISGGNVYAYSTDDAINAQKEFNVSGGRVFAYSRSNDGIDSNGTITISGGLLIGVGGSAPESGIDCDNGNNFRVNGGTVIALGGTLQSNPSSSSAQRCICYNGMKITKGETVCVTNSDGTPILSFEFPRTFSSGSFFFSTPDIKADATFTLYTGGKLSGYSEEWNGWFEGGKWSGGSKVGSVTSGSVITTVGTTGRF